MLTFEYIEKVTRMLEQTGGRDGVIHRPDRAIADRVDETAERAKMIVNFRDDPVTGHVQIIQYNSVEEMHADPNWSGHKKAGNH